MNSKYQQTPQVPLETHYVVFKDIEKQIHDYLETSSHEYLMIGLRVAYDEVDSPNEPNVLPHSVESGYLGYLDLILKCPQTERVEEEEVTEEASTESWTFPLPPALMDELYEEARNKLQDAAGTNLRVGVFYVFTGSPTQAGGVQCGCNGNSTKRLRTTSNATTGNTKTTCKKNC